MYAAVTRAIAATQQLVSFCDAIKLELVAEPISTPAFTTFSQGDST
jgi:hypothetical protein